MNHYIIFWRFGHANFQLSQARTLRDTVRRFVNENIVEERSDGLFEAHISPRKLLIYSHELEVVECRLKTDCDWMVRSVSADDWMSPFALFFRTPTQEEVKTAEQLCRNHFGRKVRLPRKCFIWELRSGTLVTFYSRSRKDVYIQPEAIKGRYLVKNDADRTVVEWTGGYDDILADLAID